MEDIRLRTDFSYWLSTIIVNINLLAHEEHSYWYGVWLQLVKENRSMVNF